MKRFHDIDHHSNSSLKKAINDMALWCMVYLPPRFREGTNAAMARGTATEFGVEVGLQGNEFVDPSEEAVKKFNELTALGVDGEARDKGASRATATRLFPKFGHYFKRAKDDGRAEAALMAMWGSEQ